MKLQTCMTPGGRQEVSRRGGGPGLANTQWGSCISSSSCPISSPNGHFSDTSELLEGMPTTYFSQPLTSTSFHAAFAWLRGQPASEIQVETGEGGGHSRSQSSSQSFPPLSLMCTDLQGCPRRAQPSPTSSTHATHTPGQTPGHAGQAVSSAFLCIPVSSGLSSGQPSVLS